MRMSLNLGCLISFTLASLMAQPATRTVKVPDATGLRLSLTESLSSATNEVDDPVRFEVTEDVKVSDTVVIAKGATAVGHVVEVEPKRRLGRAGKLNFTLDHVKAVDGSNLRLRASSTRKGDDKTGTVIVGTVMLSPLFLIMRGKDVNIPKGTALAAYVDGDREISLPGTKSASAAKPASPPPPAAPGPGAADPSTLVVKSDPDGADITVDGRFVGNTPSTIPLSPGEHVLEVEKSGFEAWHKNLSVTPGGIVTLNSVLLRKEAARELDIKANRQVSH